jgi:transposase
MTFSLSHLFLQNLPYTTEEGRNVQGEPIFWTLQKLMLAIDTQFGISLGQTATWDLVQQLGFRQKVPRPRHAKADKQAQESFKKKLMRK